MIKIQISEKLLVATINCMVDLAKSESAALASIAMEALGHIGLRCRLPGCSHDGATGKPLCLDVMSKVCNCFVIWPRFHTWHNFFIFPWTSFL